ncbi:protein ecdysoneless homolog [Impatiens glandulifera]|uniref:protein ecdysoneless homolog n=1 Tax=Impatiens glandulifera TaxID=253017 RepID=UPI001FB178AC|nr:protein ecdysoneless homolog [Impatiens glandulifera]
MEPSSSIFAEKSSRFPEDTVFYSIFPDFSVNSNTVTPQIAAADLFSQLQSLHLQILQSLSSLTSDYLWQHEPFTLSLSSPSASCFCFSSLDSRHNRQIPHLHGKLRYGDNVEDEWFLVYILFEISIRFPHLSIRVWDTDGEFLLIEAAFHLPRWINPENSVNRVFIRAGNMHIINKTQFPSPPALHESLDYLIKCEEKTMASESVQSAIKKRIDGFPDRARKNMHHVRVRVPISVAQVLKQEPCLVSLAVEGFYDRDIDSMKYAEKMERFFRNGEDIIQVSVKLSRAMYAQLVQQTFQAPRCYSMPPRSNAVEYKEAELGMKLTCGFEMIYQLRRRDGDEGKGSTWEAFRASLEKNGYFQGLLPGSQGYNRLMAKAEEYYRQSSLFSKASEMMSAPVRRIDEILSLDYSTEDFRCMELPPDDDDSWLYDGEDELNAALLEREREMEIYNTKGKMKQDSNEKKNSTSSSRKDSEDLGLSGMAKAMQTFVKKVSSYEGAEVPDNGNPEMIDFDVDRFMKELEAVTGSQSFADEGSDEDIEDASTSDMDFDESEDETDEDPYDGNEEKETFMSSYSDTLIKELKATTLDKSFVRAKEQHFVQNMGKSNVGEDMEEEEFTPVDVDVNLVKNLLDSFSSQQGLPGPASNLLGLMGLKLPQDSRKDN